MSATPSAATTTGAARFVGIAVSVYDHDTFHPLPRTVACVSGVGEILTAYAYQVDMLSDPRESEARAALRRLLEQDCLPTGGSLIVLWSGHGAPAAEGVLHLIGRDTRPGDTPEVDSGFMAGLATRTGASQVLLLFDTCYAGGGIVSAATVARRVLQELPPNADRIWVGVVASALELQQARDGVFLDRLSALLTNGPTDPELRLRWSAHSRGVRGDDVIDALLKEWHVPTQQLDAQMAGNAWVMLPNPHYDPHAPEQVVEHLLLAARGGDPGEETSYFSGRAAPLARLVDWVQTARSGIFVVTGPAGSGKSAIVGRLVSLSNAIERARLLARGPVEHADPGERSVHAHVHVRGITVERLVQELDDQLVHAEVLPPHPGAPRNRGELLGALERSPTQPVIVIDGLDEAGREAWQITSQALSLLAGSARIIVATRDLAPAEDGLSLIATLAPQGLIDLDDEASRQDATDAVRQYVARRLVDNVAATMEAAAVAEAIIRLAREEGEGLFLLARVITSQLRAEPVDTSRAGWEAALSRSVEAAFTRDMARIPPRRRDGTDLPAAVREILTALAWSYGAGLPADVWTVVASALSATQVRYDRDDVYWLLGPAGRYIVEDGEGGHAVYRLSHQRLVEHLHPRPALADLDTAQEHATPVATALIDYYQQLLTGGLEPGTPTYLWRYVWRHCADSGRVGISALRQLATAHPVFHYDLAMALNTLGVRYSEVGRRHDAVAPTEEAVTLYRQLAASNPAFLNDLASALNNLGVRYSGVGRRHEAVAPTEEAVTLRRQLAASNPAFLNDLASALNNLGIRYSEVGRQQETDLAWDDTLMQFAGQPAGLASLVVRRALARPDNELPLTGADLFNTLGRNDLPTSSVAEVRSACREIRQRHAADFDAAWSDLGSELPSWLLIDPDLFQRMVEWINMPTWQASYDYLREQAVTLLSDAAQLVFDELDLAEPENPTLQQHRVLLGVAQQHGIDAAYRSLLVREVADAWMRTDTWNASRAFLDAQ